MPEPPHVLEFQVPRIIKVNVGLRNAVDQQHPRARPVQVAQQLDAASHARPGATGRGPVPLTIRHNDIVPAPPGGSGTATRHCPCVAGQPGRLPASCRGIPIGPG